MVEQLKWLEDGTLGEWWLVDNPTRKVTGFLRLANDLWELRLYGVLAGQLSETYRQRYDRVHGWVPSAGFIELQECVATGVHYIGPPDRVTETETVSFSRLLRKGLGSSQFTSAYRSVGLRGPQLFAWFGEGGLKRLKNDEPTVGETVFAYEFQRPPSVEKAWGHWNLMFWIRAGSFPFVIERDLSITQERAIELIAPSALALSEYDARRRSLSAFLSLLTGTTVEMQIFSATPGSLGDADADQLPMHVLVNHRDLGGRGDGRERSEDYFFRYEHIANDFERLLKGWDAVIDLYGPHLADFFFDGESRDTVVRFLDATKLLHAIAEVDERNRTGNKEKRVSFRSAMISSMEKYASVRAELTDQLVDRLEATRHSLAHPQSNLGSKAAHGFELANLEVFIDSVLRCCVWSRIGVAEAEILERCRYHLKDKLSMDFWREIE